MSLSAVSRSARVSSRGSSSSSSVEISESGRLLAGGMERQMDQELAYQCRCIPHRLMGQPAWSRRTRPRLLLIRPWWRLCWERRVVEGRREKGRIDYMVCAVVKGLNTIERMERRCRVEALQIFFQLPEDFHESFFGRRITCND